MRYEQTPKTLRKLRLLSHRAFRVSSGPMRCIPYGTSLLVVMSSFACNTERPEFPPTVASSTTQSSAGKDAGGDNTSLTGNDASNADVSPSNVSPNDVSPSNVSPNDVSPSNTDVSPNDNVSPSSSPNETMEPDDKECKPGTTRKCALDGAKGTCAEGTRACTDDGEFGECDVTPREKDDCSIEGNDDDCDGIPNSDCPCVDGQTQSCGPDTDVGRCEYGVSTCRDSKFGACEGAVDRAPRNCESTQDNDCDGVPDNTLDDTCKCVPGETRECNKHPGFDGVGPCRPGNQTCELSEDGTRSNWGPCTGDVAPKASDSCIEGDNSDCSGEANTNCSCVAGRTTTCGSHHGSKGICAGVVLTCGDDGKWPGTASCMAAATTEICDNNLDENCDGTVNDAASCPCSQSPSPCAHGTCKAGSGSAYSCDCTGTGYEGTLCEKPVALVVAGPTEATSCEVTGVSDSGGVVTANCEIGASTKRGYFWTANGWAKAAPPDAQPEVWVYSLTADGTKAAGGVRGNINGGGGADFATTWSVSTNKGTLVSNAEWSVFRHMSANGQKIVSTDPGGNLLIWTNGGASGPTNWKPNSAVGGIWSGDGTKLFTSAPGEDKGFTIWTSSTAFTTVTLAEELEPVAASNDGSVLVGFFWSSSFNWIYKYSSTSSASLNSTTDCRPHSISSDGRYVLGKCPGGLYRWSDSSPSTIQSLLASTGSTVTLRTDVEGRMSYNAKYVALPHTGNSIVVVHLPSP